jgi:predicted phosphodiesterase
LKKEINLPIPEGIIELPQKTFEIKNAKRILYISDIHFPFHEKRALEVALSHGEGKDCIVICGDLFDFPSLSKFRKRPDQLFIKDAIDIGKQFFKYLREKFPKARIIFYTGNHDTRYEGYIYDHAPALFGLEFTKLEWLLDLKKLGVEYVENGVCMKAGSLYLLHGNETSAKGGGINVARTIMLRTFSNVILGHFHRTQYSSIRDMDGSEKGTFVVGCLCGLKPKWLPKNDWNWGFAEIEIYGKEFEVLNKRILQGDYNVR